MTDKLDPSRTVPVPTTNNSLTTRSSSLVKRGLEALGSQQPVTSLSDRSAEALSFSDGSTYIGEVKDGVPHGYGTMTFPSGVKYVGDYMDGMCNGNGTLSFSGGEFDGQKYVGEFKDNKYHGHGTLTLITGTTYVGEFKDGKYNGQGTYTFPNGDNYIGLLIAGDHPDQRELLSTIFKREGYKVSVAPDANEALRKLQGDNCVGMVVCDLFLPGIGGGFELIRRIRANPKWNSIYIIVLTARIQESDRVRALDLGADDYMTKPYSFSEFLARVRVGYRTISRQKI